MTTRINLGVIGYGLRINGFIRNCLRAIAPELRVVGVVDPDRERAVSLLEDCDREARFHATLDDLIREAKPDALAIGTRCNLHAPYAVEAARYDLPLFLEKPVATSMEQAVALEQAFEKSRCEVVVSFPMRVSPLCRLAKQYLADGAVGTPEHIAVLNYVPYGSIYWERGYGDHAVTQGLFLQKATHDFDYMQFLMNSPIVRVSAMANYGRVFGGQKRSGLVCSQCDEQETCLESPQNRIRNHSGGVLEDHECVFSVDRGSRETGINEDCSSALVEFASGAHGIYTQVFFSRRDAATRGAVVSGYQGTVSFDWYKRELRRIRHHAPFSDTVKVEETMSHHGGDDELARNFVAVIRGNARSQTTIQSGIQSAYACLAAKESAEKGIFVNVRQVDAESSQPFTAPSRMPATK